MDENELRGLMLSVEVPPSGADVRQAMDTARRRRRGQVVLATKAGAAVLIAAGAFVAIQPLRSDPPAAPGPAAPGPTATPVSKNACVPAVLETPGGVPGRITAVDHTGTTIAGQLSTDPAQAILWRDGKVVDLPPGATGTIVDVSGDTVVGYSATESDESTGWVWRDGKVTTLAKVKGYRWTNPSAVNAAGVIAGWVHGEALDESLPVVWTPDGKVHKLRLPALPGGPDTGSATARAISDDGKIGGEVHGFPVVWRPDGKPEVMASPYGAESGIVWAVAGRYAYGNADDIEIRWDLDVYSVSVLPDSGDLGARDGTADGTALMAGDGLEKPALRILLAGRTDPLTGPDGEFATATTISADGTTVGGSILDGERNRPVVWRCR